MKKFITAVVSSLLLFTSFSLVSSHVGETLNIPIGGTLEDKQKEIEALEKKVSDLQKQAKTLSGQIDYYDSQIKLTGLKIGQTEELIGSLTEKINTLESKLQERSRVLERQIVHTYKQGSNEPLTLFFRTPSFFVVF
jgi:peptidoglycan hydrolase CwlO-like protein